MKPVVILVHGFNVFDGGSDTIGRLRPYFEEQGASVTSFEYGWFGLFQTRFFNEEVAERLALVINDYRQAGRPVIVVGHSNGCAIAHLASMDMGFEVERYVYINPALERDLEPSLLVRAIDVYHNKEDRAVLLSRLLGLFARERPWGIMGNSGYTGEDERFWNCDTGKLFPPALGHSAVFNEDSLDFYGQMIALRALNGL